MLKTNSNLYDVVMQVWWYGIMFCFIVWLITILPQCETLSHIYCFCKDKKHRVWLGVKTGGFSKFFPST